MIKGKLGGVAVEFMLDSGSSVSLVQCDILKSVKNMTQVDTTKTLRLVTASGDTLSILRHIRTVVQLGELNIVHEFLVVNSLVTPVILGVDFLQENSLVLDFSQTPVVVHSGYPVQYPPTESNIAVARVVPIYDAANLDRACVVSVNEEIEKDIVDECATPVIKVRQK